MKAIPRSARWTCTNRVRRRWLPASDGYWLRGDLRHRLTLAAYLLPAALGDASLANLPPQAGLYACSLRAGILALLQLPPQAVSVTSAISPSGWRLAERDRPQGAGTLRALAAATAMLVAVIALLAWAVRAGAIVETSESVMVGAECGVALFLASTQLPKLLGIGAAHGNFWQARATSSAI